MKDNTLILINQTRGLSLSLKENNFSVPRQERWNKAPCMPKNSILLHKAEAQLKTRRRLISAGFFIAIPVYLRQSCPRVTMSFWNETSIPESFLQNSQGFLHHSPLPFPQGFYDIHKESVNSNSKTENTFFDEASCISCTSWRCSLLPDREQWHDKQGEKELLTSLMCRELALTEKSFACLLFFLSMSLSFDLSLFL